MKVFRPCVTFRYLVKKKKYLLKTGLAVSDYFCFTVDNRNLTEKPKCSSVSLSVFSLSYTEFHEVFNSYMNMHIYSVYNT